MEYDLPAKAIASDWDRKLIIHIMGSTRWKDIDLFISLALP